MGFEIDYLALTPEFVIIGTLLVVFALDLLLPRPKKYWIATTAIAGTTLATPSEADAHPLLLLGLAAGAAGLAAGTAIAHSVPDRVIVERERGPNCVIKEHVGRWGRLHDVEVCR